MLQKKSSFCKIHYYSFFEFLFFYFVLVEMFRSTMEVKECKEIESALQAARKWDIPLFTDVGDADIATVIAIEFLTKNTTYDHVIVCTGTDRDVWSLFSRENQIQRLAKHVSKASPNLLQYPFPALSKFNESLKVRDNNAVIQSSIRTANEMAQELCKLGLEEANIPFVVVFGGAIVNYFEKQEFGFVAQTNSIRWEEMVPLQKLSDWLCRERYFGNFNPIAMYSYSLDLFLNEYAFQQLEFRRSVLAAAKKNRFPLLHFQYGANPSVYIYDVEKRSFQFLTKEIDLTQALEFCKEKQFNPCITISGVCQDEITRKLSLSQS